MSDISPDWPMYIDADGQYGSAWETREFEYGQLTEVQWRVVAELDGYDRFRYITAVLDNDPLEIANILGEDVE
jgi:hypothetical protein